jgi:pyridoxamine 5'-phosphate oxidase
VHRLGDAPADPDPLVQLRAWLDDANAAGCPWAEVMSLATCGRAGQPAVRAVVLRELDQSGLAFDSDYQSPKAADLEANAWASVAFLWPQLQRQARARGEVEKTPSEESDRRFSAAPREQRLAIHASRQGQALSGPGELEARFKEAEQAFAGVDVPRPPHWGGYRLRPVEVEFWQGRADRLHDRLLYRREGGDGGEEWVVERLSP